MLIFKRLFKPTNLFFWICFALATVIGIVVPPKWVVEETALDVARDGKGQLTYTVERKTIVISKVVPVDEAVLGKEQIAKFNQAGKAPPITEEYVSKAETVDGKPTTLYYQRAAKRHWGFLSLLPILVAIVLCWTTREPLVALLAGTVTGAMMLRWYDITQLVFIEQFATEKVAIIILLYFWLLGGLLGIWSRTGAAQAFAEFATRKFVRGPRTAKLVAWGLGVIFFQGGTVSTVLVGTTVKPIADRENVSHEELSYIVDSTASPIAILLAFNAWPLYVQSFIFVAGVPWLATKSDRIAFFFQCIPLGFYALFAIALTFLLSLDIAPFAGRRLAAAIRRSRTTGQLDAEGAHPLTAKELETSHVPAGYRPSLVEFWVPLVLIIGIAVVTFIFMGDPKVLWGFGIALLVAAAMALLRGMSLSDLLEGFLDGMKGVVPGLAIMLLAVTVGMVTKEAGAAIYLIELVGDSIPFWLLPVVLQVLTIIIAFSIK
ncbi:MAG: Na+/H+ antiporter NhaC family protein [Planctomycetia bacterium]|jgi:Na+/H+ antiporter NhaC